MLAGWYLTGDFDALGWHAANATFVGLVGPVHLVCALGYWLGGRGRERGWVPLAALGIFVAEVLQIGFGYSRALGLHIPLGVTIVTSAVLLTIWVWRPGARLARRPYRLRGGAR